MRLLVLGGTVFLGRAIARLALAGGHQGHLRGPRATRGPLPVDGADFVAANRDDPDGLASLRGADFDAVIDVTRRPTHARRAVAALRDSVPHAVYVSSMSVYADDAVPGQRVDSAPVLEPFPDGAGRIRSGPLRGGQGGLRAGVPGRIRDGSVVHLPGRAHRGARGPGEPVRLLGAPRRRRRRGTRTRPSGGRGSAH